MKTIVEIQIYDILYERIWNIGEKINSGKNRQHLGSEENRNLLNQHDRIWNNKRLMFEKIKNLVHQTVEKFIMHENMNGFL